MKDKVGVGLMVRISEFQAKDVVNVSDGRNLGNIGDIEINLSTGKIESIIITGTGRVLGFFGKEDEVIISWKNILKIGEDVILVRHKDQNQAKLIEEG
jgi:YlmC/YmxH family sporulation protein